MKVLNLRCSNDHRFEGWFASEDDFAAQEQRGLMACPICDDHAITRLPSAPRVNVLGRGAEPRDSTPPAAPPTGSDAERQAIWLRALREVVANTEDVGERFAEEARRIHYGESEQRGIRGRASREDAAALRDEGIEVLSLPLPEAAKGSLQ